MTQAYDGAGTPLKQEGLVRTDCHCHNCSKGFIAEIDYSVDGEHVAECPHCRHHHYRTIKAGVVTEQRWGSANDSGSRGDLVKAARVWKHDVLIMQTTSASEFMRQRWLEKGKDEGA